MKEEEATLPADFTEAVFVNPSSEAVLSGEIRGTVWIATTN